MATAIAAFTFTACEDVPEPYNNPYDGYNSNKEPEVVIEPAGSGTLADPYNVARALEVCAEVGETGTEAEVYAKGVITSISEISTSFGNATFMISDDGNNALTVYRSKGLDNAPIEDENLIAKGDTVVICGKLVNFKGNTPEFTQGCYIVSITKGEGGGEEVQGNPGTAEAPLTVAEALAYIDGLGADNQSPTGFVKGKIAAISEIDTGQYGNATYTISDDGSTNNTLQIYRGYGFNGEKFTSADAIKVGDDVIITGKMVNYKGNTKQFAQGSSIYSLNGKTAGGTPSGGTASGDGTLANPYNSVAANNLASSLASGAESQEVYIKGKIVSIKEQFGTQYGNATFYISDDGTETGQFYVFRTLYLGNEKYTSGDLLNVGDDVIIYGKVTNYQGNTPETVQNGSYLYSLNGKTAGGETPNPNDNPNGDGSKDNPFNVQAIIDFVSALGADVDTKAEYYVKGIITEIPSNGISTQYNNLTFYISDDKAASNKFYVFRAKGLNGGDVTENMIKVGDEVVIFGSTWVNYKGNTPETKQGEAYIVSINDNGGDTPGEEPVDNPTTGNVTKTVSGTTITLTNTGVTASGNAVTVDLAAQGWTNAQEVTTVTLSDGTSITFDKGEGSTTPKFYDATKGVRLYAKNTIAIAGSSKAIAKVVLNCDSYQGTDYVGNELLEGKASGNTLTIVNEHTSTSGGVQLRVQTIEITYAQ